MEKANAKEKVTHELKEMFVVFLFIFPVFLAFNIYRQSLQAASFGNPYVAHGTALLNSLIMAKIVLIGEWVKLGKGTEERPLIVTVLVKSFLFTLLYMAFELLEKLIENLVHGLDFSAALHALGGPASKEYLPHAACIFLCFIPFFALLESRRVLGEGRFQSLFLRGESAAESGLIAPPQS